MSAYPADLDFEFHHKEKGTKEKKQKKQNEKGAEARGK